MQKVKRIGYLESLFKELSGGSISHLPIIKHLFKTPNTSTIAPTMPIPRIPFTYAVIIIAIPIGTNSNLKKPIL
jgi:hypothetical protein